MSPSAPDSVELDAELERGEPLRATGCVGVLIEMQITYSENFQPMGCKTTSPGVTMGVGVDQLSYAIWR